ncbi:MAG: PD-(D/E)XK nuclease family protein [Paludibacteraceae bacterium]|nr:PD-(D/E)XK nuclease family protein [Paludibacteraceae bacterium]
MDKSQDFLSFIDDFGKKYDEELRRLPYPINVIDELHINENGHSRILAQLFCYVNEKGEYEILQSLVNYIVSCNKGESSFSRIRVNKPKITQEKERIDLWVRDKDYAIIFENKIFNAVDQDAQIARYIKTTRNYGYKDENIFVVYLSPKGEEPDPQTWGNLKNSFDDRYYNLSFRDNILPWLKEQVLPTVRLKDYHLQSAIQQYVDYLEGLFSLRNIQKTMNMNLEELVKNHLKLNSQKEEQCWEVLTNFLNTMGNMAQVASKLKEECFDRISKKEINTTREELRKELLSVFNDEDIIEDNSNSEYLLVVSINKYLYEKEKVEVVVGVDQGELYCQVQYADKKERSKKLRETKLAKNLKDKKILETEGDDGVWKWCGKPNDIENLKGVLNCFKETVIECVKFIKQNKV